MKITYPYNIRIPAQLGKVIQNERKTQKMTQAQLASWTKFLCSIRATGEVAT